MGNQNSIFRKTLELSLTLQILQREQQFIPCLITRINVFIRFVKIKKIFQRKGSCLLCQSDD